MGSVAEYVEELAGEAQGRTPGSFTLNPKRAAQILTRYQLQESTDFLLKFVQAACQTSKGFNVTEGLQCDFWGWGGGDLSDIQARCESLLAGSQDEAIGCLVSGMMGALQHGPLTVELFRAGETDGQQVTLTESSFLTAWGEVESTGRPVDSFSNHDLLRVTLPESRLKLSNVNALFQSRCPWTPIRVSAGGHQLAEVMASKRACRKFAPLRQPAKAGTRARDWYRHTVGPSNHAPLIRLVKYGVVAEELAWDEGEPGAVLELCADHVVTDLSGLKLLKNEDYHALLRRATEFELRRRPSVVEVEREPELLDDSDQLCLVMLTFAVGGYLASALTKLSTGTESGFQAALLNALGCVALVALVEGRPGLRARRPLGLLAPIQRLSLRLMAFGCSLALLGLTCLLPELLPGWLDQRFTFLALFPLVLDYLLNSGSHHARGPLVSERES